MQQRRDMEEEKLRQREHRLDDHEAQLAQLRVTDTEDYNAIKKKLESDVQVVIRRMHEMVLKPA